MDNICQYSTIILSGNLTVLLIVSVTTDYWEYRSFNRTALLKTLLSLKNARVIQPRDTKSYVSLDYLLAFRSNEAFDKANLTRRLHYEPPVYAKLSSFRKTVSNCSVVDVDSTEPECQARLFLVFFEQYGNLYRDCDSLEGLSS